MVIYHLIQSLVKVIGVLLGLVGIIYTGLVVAISIRALSKTLEKEVVGR